MDNIFEAIISIGFLAVAFISWIIRLVGQSREESEAKARKQRASRPPDRRPPAGQATVRTQVPEGRSAVHSEIDAFLKQTSASTVKPQADEHDDIEFEVVPDEEVAATRQENRGQTAGGKSQRINDGIPVRDDHSDRDRNYEARREQFRASKTGRQLASRPLGAELRERIEKSITDSVLVKEQLENAERELAVAREEIRVLKDNSVAAPRGMTGARTRDVAAMLKNPQTVREAIVINEILRRPPGLSRGQGAGGRRQEAGGRRM